MISLSICKMRSAVVAGLIVGYACRAILCGHEALQLRTARSVLFHLEAGTAMAAVRRVLLSLRSRKCGKMPIMTATNANAKTR